MLISLDENFLKVWCETKPRFCWKAAQRQVKETNATDNHNSCCLSLFFVPLPQSCCLMGKIPSKQFFHHITLLCESLTCSVLSIESSSHISASFSKPPYSGLVLFFIALCSCQGSLFNTPQDVQWILSHLCAFTGMVPFLRLRLFPTPLI